MPTTFNADLLARDHKFGIVVARFNDFITARLLEGAVEAHTRHGGNADSLTIAWVPGSFELPVAAQRMAKSGKYHAVICLGCVIRGATGHYDHVAGQCSAGIARVGLDTGVPTIFGVITTETLEQAIERAGSKQGNAGEKAMLAAIEMANLFAKV
jgi:6,7-dimethyl-8-ribityllumazine synthase